MKKKLKLLLPSALIVFLLLFRFIASAFVDYTTVFNNVENRAETEEIDDSVFEWKIKDGTEEINISAEDYEVENGSFKLKWDRYKDAYYYKVYKTLVGSDTDFEVVPSNYGNVSKVLNVYSTQNLFGKVVEPSPGVKPYKNYIDVDFITINNFNNLQESDLKNSEGEYKYDVIFFGYQDGYSQYSGWSSCVVNENGYKLLENYIKEGYGVLFGHDAIFDHAGPVAYVSNYEIKDEYKTELGYYQRYIQPKLGLVTPKDFVEKAVGFDSEIDYFSRGANAPHNYLNLIGLNYGAMIPLFTYQWTAVDPYTDQANWNSDLAYFNVINPDSFTKRKLSQKGGFITRYDYRSYPNGGDSTHVKIVNEGIITTFPFDINISQDPSLPKGVLAVPATHNLGQITTGTTWIRLLLPRSYSEFLGKDNYNVGPYAEQYGMPQYGSTDAYLTTFKNIGYITTGHTSQTSIDEERVMINTLLYLSQNTRKNNSLIVDSKDIAPPILDEVTVDFNTEGIIFNATDQSSFYEFYIEAFERGALTGSSNKIEVEIASGVKGFVVTEIQSDQPLDVEIRIDGTEVYMASGDVSYIKMDSVGNGVYEATLDGIKYQYFGKEHQYQTNFDDAQDKRLHVWAIDRNGNISEPNIYTIERSQVSYEYLTEDGQKLNTVDDRLGIPEEKTLKTFGSYFNYTFADIEETHGWRIKSLELDGVLKDITDEMVNNGIKLDITTNKVKAYYEKVILDINLDYFDTAGNILINKDVAEVDKGTINEITDSLQKSYTSSLISSASVVELKGWVLKEILINGVKSTAIDLDDLIILENTIIKVVYDVQTAHVKIRKVYIDDNGEQVMISEKEVTDSQVGFKYEYDFSNPDTFTTNPQLYSYDFVSAYPLITDSGVTDLVNKTVKLFEIKDTSEEIGTDEVIDSEGYFESDLSHPEEIYDEEVLEGEEGVDNEDSQSEISETGKVNPDLEIHPVIGMKVNKLGFIKQFNKIKVVDTSEEAIDQRHDRVEEEDSEENEEDSEESEEEDSEESEEKIVTEENNESSSNARLGLFHVSALDKNTIILEYKVRKEPVKIYNAKLYGQNVAILDQTPTIIQYTAGLNFEEIITSDKFVGWKMIEDKNATLIFTDLNQSKTPGFFVHRSDDITATSMEKANTVLYAFDDLYKINYHSKTPGFGKNVMGNVPVDDKEYRVGEHIILKFADGLSVNGYTFAGWQVEINSTNVIVSPDIENNIFLIDSMDFYATWKKVTNGSGMPIQTPAPTLPTNSVTYLPISSPSGVASATISPSSSTTAKPIKTVTSSKPDTTIKPVASEELETEKLTVDNTSMPDPDIQIVPPIDITTRTINHPTSIKTMDEDITEEAKTHSSIDNKEPGGKKPNPQTDDKLIKISLLLFMGGSVAVVLMLRKVKSY